MAESIINAPTTSWTKITNYSDPNKNAETLYIYKSGEMLNINLLTRGDITFTENKVLFTLPSDIRPKSNHRLLAWNYTSDKVYVLTLNTEGQVVCYGKGNVSGRLICDAFVMLN